MAEAPATLSRRAALTAAAAALALSSAAASPRGAAAEPVAPAMGSSPTAVLRQSAEPGFIDYEVRVSLLGGLVLIVRLAARFTSSMNHARVVPYCDARAC